MLIFFCSNLAKKLLDIKNVAHIMGTTLATTVTRMAQDERQRYLLFHNLFLHGD